MRFIPKIEGDSVFFRTLPIGIFFNYNKLLVKFEMRNGRLICYSFSLVIILLLFFVFIKFVCLVYFEPLNVIEESLSNEYVKKILAGFNPKKINFHNSKSIEDKILFAEFRKALAINKLKDAREIARRINTDWYQNLTDAYIASYEYLKFRDSNFKNDNKIFRILTLSLIYIQGGAKEDILLEAASKVAKSLNENELYAIAPIITDEFISRGMHLQNLKYWDKINPNSYEIRLADLKEIILRKDIPKSSSELMKYMRLKLFLPIINNYKRGIITRNKAVEEIDKKLKICVQNNKHLTIDCIDEIYFFLFEIGEKERAEYLLSDFIEDEESSWLMKLSSVTLKKKKKFVQIFVQTGRIELAEEVVFSEPHFLRRIALCGELISAIYKKDELEGIKYFDKLNTFLFRTKLYYPFIFGYKNWQYEK